MPKRPFATAEVPPAFVPIRLPWTIFPDAVSEKITRPSKVLPESTLPAPAAVPPIVLFGVLTSVMPPEFASAAVPAAFVPIRLPCTTSPEPASICTPGPAFPEARFRSALPRPADRVVQAEDVDPLPIAQGRRSRSVSPDEVAHDHVVVRRDMDAVAPNPLDRQPADRAAGRALRRGSTPPPRHLCRCPRTRYSICVEPLAERVGVGGRTVLAIAVDRHGSVMIGSAEVGRIVCTPEPGILKSIVSCSIGTDADDVADVLVVVGRRDRLAQRHHPVGRVDRVPRACHGDDRHQQAILD